MTELKPCPFCGGSGKISYKWLDHRTHIIAPPLSVMETDGIDIWCEKHITEHIYHYRVQVICKRCHARGKPIRAMAKGYSPYAKYEEAVKAYEPFVEQAIEAWNRRVEEETE